MPRNNTIEIIYSNHQSCVRFDAPYAELDQEWKLIESYIKGWKLGAPNNGVNKNFQTSIDYWWYDTNANMLFSAYASAGIALAFSAVVFLLHSQSLTLALYSLCTIT